MEANALRGLSEGYGTCHTVRAKSGLPASSENGYHPRQFRVHLGNPGGVFAVTTQYLLKQGGVLRYEGFPEIRQ